MDEGACSSDKSPTEVLMWALEEVGEVADRVAVIVIHKSGTSVSQYSNARSAAELVGMLVLAQSLTGQE